METLKRILTGCHSLMGLMMKILKDSQNSKEKEMGIQNYLETEKEILKKRLKEK
jgi:hypothetical protein